MKTLILILLDESGSMDYQKSDVIDGFNTFIESQKEIKEDEASVTFLKFNTQVSVVLKCVPVLNVLALQFKPNGGTSLFDAIWEGVQLGEETEHLFDRVLCVIMTDGEDNSSRKITSVGVGDLIKKKEGQGKWTFLYIGENPSKWAQQTGTSVLNTACYNQQAQRSNFVNLQTGVTNFRNQCMPQMPAVLAHAQAPPQMYQPLPPRPLALPPVSNAAPQPAVAAIAMPGYPPAYSK